MDPNMTQSEKEKWLKDNNYDGLYCPDLDLDCACLIEDLMPCGYARLECIPGYRKDADPDSGYEFMVGSGKGS